MAFNLASFIWFRFIWGANVMTYKDQFTVAESTQYMVMNVVDELYDHSEMTGQFIGLCRAIDFELTAADVTHEAIKKAML